MMEDELDRMLSRQDEIVPSSGFVMSVMDAVRREAAASEPAPLPPIAFPWLRALPIMIALVAAVAMLIAGAVEILRGPASVTQQPLLPQAVTHALTQMNAIWLAVSLLIAFFSAFLAMRFAIGKR
ncbi:hypothetical protein H7849_10770 [Alloacidobacterium dinghuense]|uniref:Uncharacterized protein n=1 Tax=Alloacidobacterium dinghuense TaxID=2763107 RepID=A0A7G8BP56_9BACT|nr:hypothetical protein [Alloacidobacterium dinghuense]QNI34326.1 hypothetical protein H7849_10770 [Alloacidobacterium dinghuense]